MSPRKPAPRRRTPKPSAPPQPEARGVVVTMNGLGELPRPIRLHLLSELQKLEGASEPASVLGNVVTGNAAGIQQESHGASIVRRLTQMLDDLSEQMHTVEQGVRRLGGTWPWPDKNGPADAALASTEADSFQAAIEARLTRLAGNVGHARILADRLNQIV